MAWEISFLESLRILRGLPLLDGLMLTVSSWGDFGAVWILLAGFLLARKETRAAGTVMAAALVIDAAVCNGILKPLIARPRPELSGVFPLIPMPTDFSFPSGHTAASFAAAVSLALARSRLAVPALFLAGLIAFSRLYLGVHFPTDVAAGILVGTAAAFLAKHLVRSAAERGAAPAFCGGPEKERRGT